MSNSLETIFEAKQLKAKEDRKNQILEEISKLKVSSEDFEILRYVFENRAKIYRNRKLIDLLG